MVSLAGRFEGPRASHQDKTLQDALLKLATDPQAAATEYAKATHNCCFCNQDLADPRSEAAGYGPVCADKWGLPWGEKS
jgi:hypothetical protein